MAGFSFLVLFCLSGALYIKAEEQSYPALPFTAKLKWKRLEFAQFEAQALGKPLLFFIGKSWCRKCHDLIKDMENNEDIVSLHEEFAMAKAEDEETPVGTKYNLDGKYAPQIVFEDRKGNLLKKFVNEDSTNSSHKYYYQNAEEVLKTMRLVLKHGDIGQGFGKRYDWKEYKAGLEVAKTDNKPVMLVIHQDWCGACQRLKPKFANSTEMIQLSEKFVMINSDEDEVAKNKDYDIDGEYYPRILFLEPTGAVLRDMWNIGTKHTHVKFYYGDEEEILQSMTRVLQMFESALDRGFGKHLRWVPLNTAISLARQQKKPILLIIHKSYCGACKALKVRVRKSKPFAEMAEKFILVNAEDDEEPDDPQFDIDGAYVPRIMFLDPNGNVEPTLRNDEEEFAKVQFAYGKMEKLVSNMKLALEMGLGTREGKVEEVKQQQQEQTQETATKEHAEELTKPKQEEDLSFAPGLEWTPVANATKEARKSHRAIMYIIHSGWCSFSKATKEHAEELTFREIFRTSEDVRHLSSRFVLVEIQDDKDDVPDKMDIDGKYTPRVLFADMTGQIKRTLNNTKSELNDTKFYYGNAEELLAGMYAALGAIDTDLSRGFGDHLEWQTYAKAKELAKKENKPIFILIHRSWCAACKALKPILANSWDISQLRVHFIMVNTEDDEEPDENQLKVDGGYYPRLYILDSNAKVVKELHNEDIKYLKYKFSYAYEEQIVSLMNRAYRHFADLVKATASPPSSNPEIRRDPAKSLQSVRFDEGMRLAKEQNKPVLFLIHRKTCPACKAVHRMLGRDTDFLNKVQKFILIDIEDDEFPDLSDKYDVDGTYVPRIYFLNPEGIIWKDIWNVGTQYQSNKFYYYETVSVLRSMDKAIKAFEEYNASKGKDEL